MKLHNIYTVSTTTLFQKSTQTKKSQTQENLSQAS